MWNGKYIAVLVPPFVFFLLVGSMHWIFVLGISTLLLVFAIWRNFIGAIYSLAIYIFVVINFILHPFPVAESAEDALEVVVGMFILFSISTAYWIEEMGYLYRQFKEWIEKRKTHEK